MWQKLFLNGSDEMFVIGEDKKGAKEKVKLGGTWGKHTGSSLAHDILLVLITPVKHLEGLNQVVFFCWERFVRRLE